jgi:hypothetical protein
MRQSHPFTLKIFVAEGDPDGLRLIERSNWTGKVVVFPRSLFPQIQSREELRLAGIYMLIGPDDAGGGSMAYIGEGDPVGPRLASHFAKKDFWTWAVFFVAGPGNLNKAHVQFLESRLIKLANEAKRMRLDNANHPAEPSLSEADYADMEVFLQNMLEMLPVLGIKAFESASDRMGSSSERIVLTCSGKGVIARGYESSEGFVIKEGSQAVSVENEAPSFEQHVSHVHKLRRELIRRGVVEPDSGSLKFTQDYPFSSPSNAAAFVFGASSNGRTAWKDSKRL